MIDGDNQGNPFPGKSDFIWLEKYCIENYLLNIKFIKKSLHMKKGEVQEIILNAIMANRNKIFSKNKYFYFLIDRLKKTDIQQESIDQIDASEILSHILKTIRKTRKGLTKELINSANNKKQLYEIFPEQLVKIFE